MHTVADIIEAFGGSTRLSAIINRPMPTVASWKTRNSIPASEWQGIVHAARDLGIALKYEDLAAIEAGCRKAVSA